MAKTFKSLLGDDVVNTRTLLHEAIPITGTNSSGTKSDNNINSEVFLNTKKNLGKQLELANKRELTVAIICGENEFKDNTVTIKNLKGVKGENSQTIPKSNLINEIKKLI